jgi:hypothetical protein
VDLILIKEPIRFGEIISEILRQKMTKGLINAKRNYLMGRFLKA